MTPARTAAGTPNGHADHFDPPADDRTTQHLRRTIKRRQTLPGGRAVVGGLLVSAAALGVFVISGRQGESTPTTAHVVVNSSLPAGTVISADDLVVEQMVLPQATAQQTFAVAEDLVGAVTLSALGSGDLVRYADVATSSGTTDELPSYREVVIGLPRLRGDALALRPGDRVDVLATDGSGTSARTSVVATDIVVLRTSGQSSDSLSLSGDISVVLAIPDGQLATAVVHAISASAPTLVKSTHSVDDPLPGGPFPEGHDRNEGQAQ